LKAYGAVSCNFLGRWGEFQLCSTSAGDQSVCSYRAMTSLISWRHGGITYISDTAFLGRTDWEGKERDLPSI